MNSYRLPVALGTAALLIAVLGFAPLADGHGVVHAIFAHNADKVDGKHAVGARATLSARRGRLVATRASTGQLPNSVIPKGLNATVLGQWVTLCAASDGECAEATGSARCPGGMLVTGGGWLSSETNPLFDVAVLDAAPLGDGFVVRMINNSDSAASFRAVAACTPWKANGTTAVAERIAKKLEARRRPTRG